MKNLLIVSALLCSCALQAQTEVSAYGSDKAQTEGITYMLPRNQIRITVTAVKRTYTPGEYCRYAEEYLRLSDVRPESSVSWELQKVEARCVAVPDPRKAFYITLTEKSSTSRAQLSPDGLLLAINDRQDYAPAPAPEPLKTKPRKKLSPEDYYTEDIIRASSAMATARLIADEIYEHINYIGRHESIAQFAEIKDRVVIVNGVSKAYAMTGWRIGFIAAPEWIVKGCNKLQGQYTSGPCSVSQKAAEAAYTGSQQCVEEMRQVNREIRKPTIANMVEGGRTPFLSAPELQEIGYSLVVYPIAALYTATKAVYDMLVDFKKNGTPAAYRDRMVDFSQFNEFIGLPAIRRIEAGDLGGVEKKFI